MGSSSGSDSSSEPTDSMPGSFGGSSSNSSHPSSGTSNGPLVFEGLTRGWHDYSGDWHAGEHSASDYVTETIATLDDETKASLDAPLEHLGLWQRAARRDRSHVPDQVTALARDAIYQISNTVGAANSRHGGKFNKEHQALFELAQPDYQGQLSLAQSRLWTNGHIGTARRLVNSAASTVASGVVSGASMVASGLWNTVAGGEKTTAPSYPPAQWDPTHGSFSQSYPQRYAPSMPQEFHRQPQSHYSPPPPGWTQSQSPSYSAASRPAGTNTSLASGAANWLSKKWNGPNACMSRM